MISSPPTSRNSTNPISSERVSEFIPLSLLVEAGDDFLILNKLYSEATGSGGEAAKNRYRYFQELLSAEQRHYLKYSVMRPSFKLSPLATRFRQQTIQTSSFVLEQSPEKEQWEPRLYLTYRVS